MKLSVAGLPATALTEHAILEMVAERLALGYKTYGPFDSNKKKEWKVEALMEMLDGMVYISKAILELEPAVLAHAKRTARAEVSDPSEDGREVHLVRPGEASWEQDGDSAPDTERMPGGGRAAAEHGGAK